MSKYFLTTIVLGASLLMATDTNVFAGHGGGGGGRGGGGGGRGGYGGGYGGRGYGYGGGFYGGGFYGGGLFYGDYLLGGGYPGYYAPYSYPYAAPSYYPAPLGPYSAAPGPSYSAPQASANSYYYPPIEVAAIPATIHVVLPDAQATVLFDGHKTSTTGSDRYYHTPDLARGGSYKYQLRVTWTENGQAVSQERTVAVSPGQTAEVVFTRGAGAAISAAK